MTAVTVRSQETVHAVTASPATAPAQLFGVHPVQEGRTTLPGGHFNFALVPGQRISDGIVVENFSNHILHFHVYGADLLTATGGGQTPAQPTAKMHAVGAWIAVSVTTIAVAAHSRATDTFTLTVPIVVSSGQHLGAVVAAASVGVTPQGNPIEARAALIAVVTVPGVARPSAGLTPLVGSAATAGQVGFGITISNSGNVLLTYAGVLVIDDAAGHRLATLLLTPTNTYVVPSGHVPLAAIWRDPADLAAMYRAHADRHRFRQRTSGSYADLAIHRFALVTQCSGVCPRRAWHGSCGDDPSRGVDRASCRRTAKQHGRATSPSWDRQPMIQTPSIERGGRVTSNSTTRWRCARSHGET